MANKPYGQVSLINLPSPNKITDPRQKSIDVNDLFLTRFLPPWSRPASLPAATWRQWVLNQPVAVDCRETLISNVLALDWKITPVDTNYKEELNPTIRYYTKLFTNGGGYPGLGLDYSGLVEWISQDLLDTPFGGAAEIGRKGHKENGRVQWIRPLDAGTLYPTLNQQFPVIQYWQGYNAVVFNDFEIARTYMSPHNFIWREGWGMAPPEKVYFAIDLLGRGDKYYANLLLDVPTAGILDLGDMEKSSAEEWIAAFKSFVNDNTTSFRVPVLYEHNNKVEFLPFGKVPNDIMFDKITHRYATLVCSAYGLSPSDIGLSTSTSSGETLAGSIRQDKRSKRNGFARLKKKLKHFFNQILPDTLQFNFIDYDDELTLALGRARLATFTGLGLMLDKGVFTPQEVRSQSIQEGLVSINIPDELPPDAKPAPVPTPNKQVGELGNPVAPSAGGMGGLKSLVVKSKPKNLEKLIDGLVRDIAPKIIDTLSSVSEDEIDIWRSLISESLFSDDDSLGLQEIIGNMVGSLHSSISLNLDGIEDEIKSALGEEYSEVPLRSYVSKLKTDLKKTVDVFIGKTVVFLLNDVLRDVDVADQETIQYNLITKSVKDRIEASLADFISVHVQDEVQKILDQIRVEN